MCTSQIMFFITSTTPHFNHFPFQLFTPHRLYNRSRYARHCVQTKVYTMSSALIATISAKLKVLTIFSLASDAPASALCAERSEISLLMFSIHTPHQQNKQTIQPSQSKTNSVRKFSTIRAMPTTQRLGTCICQGIQQYSSIYCCIRKIIQIIAKAERSEISLLMLYLHMWPQIGHLHFGSAFITTFPTGIQVIISIIIRTRNLPAILQPILRRCVVALPHLPT